MSVADDLDAVMRRVAAKGGQVYRFELSPAHFDELEVADRLGVEIELTENPDVIIYHGARVERGRPDTGTWVHIVGDLNFDTSPP